MNLDNIEILGTQPLHPNQEIVVGKTEPIELTVQHLSLPDDQVRTNFVHLEAEQQHGNARVMLLVGADSQNGPNLDISFVETIVIDPAGFSPSEVAAMNKRLPGITLLKGQHQVPRIYGLGALKDSPITPQLALVPEGGLRVFLAGSGNNSGDFDVYVKNKLGTVVKVEKQS
jgi:hypothetical protein